MKKLLQWIGSHRYCLALSYYIFYLAAFVALERLVEPRYIIYSFLDDYIPFNEWFLIPYFSWLIWMPGALLYFLIKCKQDFQNLCFLMFSGMTICLVIYAAFPNAVNLRAELVGDSPLRRLALYLREIDTPTNVCPSIHVSSTLAILLVTLRSKLFKGRRAVKAGAVILAVFICASTVFLRQHSVIDVLCGAALTGLLYAITYHTQWRKALRRTPLRVFCQKETKPLRV